MVDLFVLDTVASCEFLWSIPPGRIGKDKSTMWQLRKWMPMLPKRSAMLETENTLQNKPHWCILHFHLKRTWSLILCRSLHIYLTDMKCTKLLWIENFKNHGHLEAVFSDPISSLSTKNAPGEADEFRRIIPYLSPQASVKPNIPKRLQVQLAKVILQAVSAQWTSPITCVDAG